MTMMPIQIDRRKFPNCPKSVPMSMLSEKWAENNHSQSLGRLRERQGLVVEEILASIEKRRWNSTGPI